MINEKNIEKIFGTLEKYLEEKSMIQKFVDENFNPFQILVATILSARTKDEQSEKISRKLFQKVKEPRDLLNFSEMELANEIYPVGFYRTKARNLIKLAKVLLERYNGKVPEKMEELLELPGVGRKTANIVLAYAFNKPAIAVDTHVHRIFNRWGFVKTKKPEETEEELRKKLPKRLWRKVNNLLVNFGKNICKPINPLCRECPINSICPFPKHKDKKILLQ
jgi:endonuclease-3